MHAILSKLFDKYWYASDDGCSECASGVPFDAIEVCILFDFVVDGFTIFVGDVVVDDFDGVLGEELFDL